MSRQLRKVYGAIKALDGFVKARNGSSDFLIGDELTIADIAAACMLGMMNMVETQFELIKWKEEYPVLVRWWGHWRNGRVFGRRGLSCLT